jgi:DMSO/TMAO reductase YedYZ molybdopterin-dependent catalytic subunit
MDPEPRRARSRRRIGATAGLAGTAALTGALAVSHTFVRSVPFPPASAAQAIVRAAPGGLATFVIDRLQHASLPLATAATCGAFVLAGAVLGMVLPRVDQALGPRLRPLSGALILLPLPAVSIALYPSDPQFVPRLAFALATLPLYVLSGAISGSVYHRLRMPSARAETLRGASVDRSRRVVLRALWIGALGSILGLADLGRLIYRRPNPGLRLLSLPRLTKASPRPASPIDAAFDDILGLTPEVTPNELFYVVDEEIIDPDIDPETWRLTVGGLVERPFRVTYAELKALPAVERYQTLECISNEVGGHLISTARWVGVPLPVLLDRAGVGAEAVEVVFRAAGGYSDSLPIAKAVDQSTLIAIGMNGHVLPREHGFPARVLSTGTYGMKNPKWLTDIVVVDRPYTGFWEGRGWSKSAVVKTSSRIDVPAGGDVGDELTVAGVAFAGDRGISRVEVSTDRGRTWNQAELKTALSNETWRQWRYRWTPSDRGRTDIVVRAYDGSGARQAAVRMAPHPDGASGYDAVTVIH